MVVPLQGYQASADWTLVRLDRVRDRTEVGRTNGQGAHLGCLGVPNVLEDLPREVLVGGVGAVVRREQVEEHPCHHFQRKVGRAGLVPVNKRVTLGLDLGGKMEGPMEI